MGGIHPFTIFNVRPFIKIDKPQDEDEGNRKVQLFTTKKKKKKEKKKEKTQEAKP